MDKLTLYTIFWVLLGQTLFAQTDSTYVRTFPEKITARIGFQNTANSFIISEIGTNTNLVLEPNKKSYLGISLLFRSVELDAGFAPNFMANNKDNEGASLFTLNFRMFIGKWMQTIDYYNQKAFYGNLNGEEIYLPDIRTTKLGGATSYIFNDKFSFRAIGFQNEWQKKSAGSFIPRMTFYYTKFRWRIEDFNETSNSYDITVGPGYYYNMVLAKNFIISAGATAGIGVNVTAYEEETFTSTLYEMGLRGVIGYNSEHFFTGINSNVIILQHNEDRATRMDDTITFVELYLGYRFDAPKKLLKIADDVNSKLGL